MVRDAPSSLRSATGRSPVRHRQSPHRYLRSMYRVPYRWRDAHDLLGIYAVFMRSLILTGYGARRSLLAPLGDWTQSCQPMLSISSLPPLSCRAVSTTRHSRLVYLGLFYSCLRYLLRSPISHCFFLCLLYFLWCLPYRRRATTRHSRSVHSRTLTLGIDAMFMRSLCLRYLLRSPIVDFFVPRLGLTLTRGEKSCSSTENRTLDLTVHSDILEPTELISLSDV
jgi:hypothetical protein